MVSRITRGISAFLLSHEWLNCASLSLGLRLLLACRLSLTTARHLKSLHRHLKTTHLMHAGGLRRVIKPTPPRVEDPRPPRYDPRPLLMATDIPHKRSDKPRRDPRYDERLPLYYPPGFGYDDSKI